MNGKEQKARFRVWGVRRGDEERGLGGGAIAEKGGEE